MPRQRHRHAAARPEPLEPRRLLAGDGSLLYNVNQTTSDLGAEQLVSAGPSLGYFVGRGYGGVGAELWRTDGTAAGTYRVKDVCPGVKGSNPSGLTMVGDVLYFVADDGTTGPELWRSDGTEAGTVLVTDLRAGAKGSVPTNLTAVGDTLYFVGDLGTSNTQVYRLPDADGPAGANLPAAVPGQPSSGTSASNKYLIAYNGSLLFGANNGLYRVADPAASAVLVGGGPNTWLNPRSPVLFNGQVYFVADKLVYNTGRGDLWRSDGTAAGTALVKQIDLGASDFTSLGSLTASGDLLYFVAQDYSAGTHYELWRSDGTTAGTYSIGTTGSNSALYFSMTPVGTRSVLFPATTAAAGRESWVSDGTAANTRLLAEFTPGAADGWLDGTVRKLGSQAFVPVPRANAAPELWATNGTAARTELVKAVGEAGNVLTPLGAVGGRLLFAGGPFVGQGDLYATDGTASGTVRVGSADAGSGSSVKANPPTTGYGPEPTLLPAGGGVTYFAANDGVHGTELWRGNPVGSAVGAELVADLAPAGLSSSPTHLTRTADGSVFFAADPVGDGRLFYLYRLAPGGGAPERVSGAGVGPQLLTAVGPDLYFSTGTFIYRWDPASNAAARVSYGGVALTNPHDLTAVGPYLYFGATASAAQGDEPWRTDGTAAGTVQLKDIAAGTGGSAPKDFTAVGSTVYFQAGNAIWRTDGTPANTVQVTTVAAISTLGGDLHGFAGTLYFGGNALLRLDAATGQWTIAAQVGGATAFADAGDGRFYFVGGSGIPGTAYRTDGTPAGTTRLTGTGTAAPGLTVDGLIAAGGRGYVWGHTGTYVAPGDAELWATGPDGSLAKVRTTAPYLAGSAWLTAYASDYRRPIPSADDRYLYFPAYTPAAGVEPYRLSLAAASTAAAGGPYAVPEGGSVALAGSGSAAAGATLAAYEWDLDYDGVTFTVDATGATPAFSAAGLDGPATRTVGLRVRDDLGQVSPVAAAVVTVANVAPTATFAAGPAVALGTPSAVSFTNPADPSPADVAAGFVYSFDFNNDGDFDDLGDVKGSASPTAAFFAYPAAGSYVVRGRVADKDGGFADYTATAVVTAPTPTTTPLVLRAAADAHVRDGSLSATNYGSAAELEVRKSSIAGNQREAYLRFDLTGVASASQIASAVVRVYGKLSAAGSVPVALYPVDGTGWTEAGLTWDNRPARGTSALATDTVAATTAAWFEYDVTAYLKQQKAAGATAVSFALAATAFTTPWAAFASDEAAANRPELKVVQQPTAPAGLSASAGAAYTLTAPNGAAGPAALAVTAGTVTLTADAAATYPNLTVTVGGGTVLALTAAQHLAGLSVADGGTVTFARGAATAGRALVVGNLWVGSAGRLDLTNNALVVRYAAGQGPATLAAVTALAKAGYRAGDWGGPGLTSSDAAADAGRTLGLGVADNAAAGRGTFAGEAGLDGNQILARPTRYGDATLDGAVTVDDLSRLAQAYGQAGRGWLGGDFNYDGTTGVDDLSRLAQNYNAAPLGAAAVAGPAVAAGSAKTATGGASEGTSTTASVEPPPRLSVGDASVAEGNAGTTRLTFTVRLDAASATPVTVRYATADGTAKAGSDYAATAGSLTFAAGQLARTVTVAVKGDRAREAAETLFLNLAQPAGAKLADGRGLGTVRDDD